MLHQLEWCLSDADIGPFLPLNWKTGGSLGLLEVFFKGLIGRLRRHWEANTISEVG